jgi:hypothetical protein
MHGKYQAKVSKMNTLRKFRGEGEGTASMLIHP